MKIKKIVAALFAVSAVASQLAYATNGDTMMAVGAENTALGGTGVAHYVGAESTFANPAMLGKSTGSEVTGGITYFKPTVTNTGIGLAGSSGTAVTSGANPSAIPDISYSSRINGNWSYGVAMAGIAGMGVDYSGAPGMSSGTAYVSAKTTMSILKVIPTIAYNDKNYGIGFSPVYQYGSLEISYDTTGFPQGAPYNPGATNNSAWGYALGGYYDITSAFTVAASYNSQIAMTYGTELSGAGIGFGQNGSPGYGSVLSNKLTQPAEARAGFSYVMAEKYTLTADYHLIQWAEADGYKDFGWKDQTIAAIGGKYAGDGFWLGLGYNSTNNPIGTFANSTLTPAGNNGGVVNMFNNMMFPGIIASSYTFGGGYNLSKGLELDAAAMLSPQVTSTVDISDAVQKAAGSAFNTTTHSQESIELSLRYKF